MRRTKPLALTLGLIVCLSVTVPAFADFDRLTSRIERLHNVDRQWIPMFGLGRLIVRLFKPEGVRDVKLAIFEDHTRGGDIDLESIVGDSVDGSWRRVVRARSKNGEEHLVYVMDEGRFMRMMVVSREDEEIVVVETAINPDIFVEQMARGEFGSHYGAD